MAEKNAVEIAKRDALDLISICPTHVMVPLSESPTNANVAYRIFGSQMKGKYWPIVDARDVANALLLAYENPIAKGRYICTSHTITEKDLREKMRILNPNLNLPPTMCVEDDDIYEEVNSYVDEEDVKRRLSSMKLQIDLDWWFKLIEETLADSFRNTNIMRRYKPKSTMSYIS